MSEEHEPGAPYVDYVEHIYRFTFRPEILSFDQLENRGNSSTLMEYTDASLKAGFFPDVFASRGDVSSVGHALEFDRAVTLIGPRGTGKSTLAYRYLTTECGVDWDDLVSTVTPGQLTFSQDSHPAIFLLWDFERISFEDPSDQPVTNVDMYASMYRDLEVYFHQRMSRLFDELSNHELWRAYRVTESTYYDGARSILYSAGVDVEDPVAIEAFTASVDRDLPVGNSWLTEYDLAYFRQSPRDKFDDLLDLITSPKWASSRVVIFLDNVDYVPPAVQISAAEEYQRLYRDHATNVFLIMTARPTTLERFRQQGPGALVGKRIEVSFSFRHLLKVLEKRLQFADRWLQTLKYFADERGGSGRDFVFSGRALDEVQELIRLRQEVRDEGGQDEIAERLERAREVQRMLRRNDVMQAISHDLAVWHNHSIRSALFELSDLFDLLLATSTHSNRGGKKQSTAFMRSALYCHMFRSTTFGGHPTIVSHCRPKEDPSNILEFLDLHILEFLANSPRDKSLTFADVRTAFEPFRVSAGQVESSLHALNAYRGYEADGLVKIYSVDPIEDRTVLEAAPAADFFLKTLSTSHYYLGLCEMSDNGEEIGYADSRKPVPRVETVYLEALNRVKSVLLPAARREVIACHVEAPERLVSLREWRTSGPTGTDLAHHYAVECAEHLMGLGDNAFAASEEAKAAIRAIGKDVRGFKKYLRDAHQAIGR